MPKIPSQMTRTVLPAAGGGANARSIAGGSGGGLTSAGQAIAGGAANLAHAFAYAQHQRDAVNAHLDSLRQRTGALQLAMDGATGLDEDMKGLYAQIQQQQGNDPSTWRVTIKNQDGEDISVLPDDGIKLLVQNRIDKGMNDAEDFYGPEAKLHVAQALTRDGYNAQSKFSDAVLKLKHDKQLADFDTVTQRLVDQAADPTNRFRESTKLDLQDLIDQHVQKGILTPGDGRKIHAQTKADIGHKFWTAYAIQNPDKMMEIAAGRGGTAVVSETGATTEPGTLKRLPEDLDPAHLDEYVKIAEAQNHRIFSAFERQQKAFAAKAEVESRQAYSDLISQATHEDAALAIEQHRGILGPRYDDAVKFNHEWNNARRIERTRATEESSHFTQFDLLELAKRAMFIPELLDPANPDAITNAVVRQHVTDNRDLLPDHAAPILEAIQSAQKYQEQEDSGKRQAERDGFKLLERTFTVPQALDASSAFTLKRLEQDAYSQLASEYLKNPQGDRNELALNLSAKFTPRVLAVQKARADELDQELLAMEKGFPTGMANEKHTLNAGTRKQLETQNPILRGLFRLYDAKAERWQQLVEQGQRTAESETHAKPR